MQKVKAEISLENIRHNAQIFVRRTKAKLCAVVKANAYGHGAEEVVNALSSIADCFAVALIEEGVCIRTAALDKEILVFTPPICEEDAFALACNQFIATIPDLWTAKLLHSVGEKYHIKITAHLKVNTGMNRYGMSIAELGKVCRFLSQSVWVQTQGIYSHLYSTDLKTSQEQRNRFLAMRKAFKRYFPDGIAHLSATYGSLLGDDFAFDMVRVGVGLYGYLPSLSPSAGVGNIPALKKAMRIRAVTVASRKPSYGGLGYGNCLSKTQLQQIGAVSVCRAGYADGFLRWQKNGADGCEDNVNNLCMDVCIRKNNKKRGEEVYLLTNAEQAASQTGRISYEVLCTATMRAEFVYEDNEITIRRGKGRKRTRKEG